jgi:acyl carrier protein
MSNLFPRIRIIISEAIRCPLDAVTIDSTFEQLGITSLDAINIVFAVEGEFEIQVPDSVVIGIRDVRGIMTAMGAVE